jgi:hypothetical protein
MTSGAIRFLSYAYPPNALGYCGPDDHGALADYRRAGVVDPGLVGLIHEFEGAWPYLELIGSNVGLDPLDDRVVDAYWIGGSLLTRIPISTIAVSLRDRFQDRAGSSWEEIGEALGAGAKPHHAFHVFGVYPWVGLMRSGMIGEPLRILQSCRIRWGQVIGGAEDTVTVLSQPLEFDGERLHLGVPRQEEARWSGPDLAQGEMVTLHWDWVCEPVDRSTVTTLATETDALIAIANRSIAKPRTGALS